MNVYCKMKDFFSEYVPLIISALDLDVQIHAQALSKDKPSSKHIGVWLQMKKEGDDVSSHQLMILAVHILLIGPLPYDFYGAIVQ